MSRERIKHLIAERDKSKQDQHDHEEQPGTTREMSFCERAKLLSSRREMSRFKKYTCPI